MSDDESIDDDDQDEPFQLEPYHGFQAFCNLIESLGWCATLAWLAWVVGRCTVIYLGHQ